MKPSGLIRLGGTEGVAGRSGDWELKTLGGSRQVSWRDLREGLRSGRYSGIESVRRLDGDWGPLFGRPMYREVFVEEHEPRDHAKLRAARRIRGLSEWSGVSLAAATCCLLLAVIPGGLITQILLLGALLSGIVAGLLRLRTAMHQHELDLLTDRCLPPITPPPPLDPDWAALAAADEVEASLRAEAHPED